MIKTNKKYQDKIYIEKEKYKKGEITVDELRLNIKKILWGKD